ncbi:MAG: hypothetical protein EZS28_025016 [Streblomastix strix]|uniref:DDE-1 domain-containing protein n=1 Tax=Streblomastix strix TaxID=222440 RepID=A0A5J4VAH8_9EUKA|nr:MAG: hypothetical protein EZS28_025016 [Streblomastix strix]
MVKESDIDEFEQAAEVLLKDISCELILAADEFYYQQFADSRIYVIIVKASDKFKKLHFPVDHSEKRLSIMAGAALSNDIHLSYVIVKQPLNIDKFKVAGVGDGIDVVPVEGEGTNMTTALHVNRLEKIVVPQVEKTRKRLKLSNETCALLYVDNCPSHTQDFKCAGYSQRWDDNGTCYEQVVHESLAAVREAIEADVLLIIN